MRRLALLALLLTLLLAGCPGPDAPGPAGSPASRVEPPAPAPPPRAAVAAVDTPSAPLVDAATPEAEPAGAPRQAERERMVAAQIEAPRDGRDPVRDPRVLVAMRRVPRHAFVPERLRDYAYEDGPLPIGHGQTISQPYVVALMTELLQLKPGARVLEIGTGSGYQAAVLAELSDQVYSIEIVQPLAARAKATLTAAGYGAIHLRHADGYDGWPDAAPFDAIIVTCAAGHLPPPLWDQLAPGGRIVIPIGDPQALQRLVVVTRTADGGRRSETITAVAFVPMTRAD